MLNVVKNVYGIKSIQFVLWQVAFRLKSLEEKNAGIQELRFALRRKNDIQT